MAQPIGSETMFYVLISVTPSPDSPDETHGPGPPPCQALFLLHTPRPGIVQTCFSQLVREIRCYEAANSYGIVSCMFHVKAIQKLSIKTI